MRYRTRLLLFVCIFAVAPLHSQVTLKRDSLYSQSLGRAKQVVVLLPSGYTDSREYPVLYLLHGLTGNCTDWTSRTKLKLYAEAFSFIIVMPDGEDSWYVNSRGVPENRFEDYMMKDIPEYVRQHYSIDTARQAIAGLSMGGYGSLMLALRHPGRFRFAGGLSSAITVPRVMDERGRTAPLNESTVSLVTAFGSEPGTFRKEHDVMWLYRDLPAASIPYIYLSIGTQDGYRDFLPAHRELTDSLRGRGILYEYHELPGEHNWHFWDQEIRPLLQRLQDILMTKP